jgi:hypothetical protein
MKVTLVFVPPGGGDAEYSLQFELPSVPQPGSYISITRPDQQVGTEDFIVRRNLWSLEHPTTGAYETESTRQAGAMRELWVQCEFARGPYSSDEHRRTCDGFERGGREVQSFETSAF